MAFKLAEAFVEFRQRGLTGLQRSITGIGNSMRTASSITQGFQTKLMSLGAIAMRVAAPIAAMATGAGMVKLASDAETLRVQFDVLLGSVEASKKMLGEMRDFAASTPFQMGDLAEAAKTLMGVGEVAQDDVIPTLRQLGDIAALSGKDIKNLSLLFAQARVNGRLMADDVRRIAEAGLPLMEVLREKTGKTGAALRKEIEAGAATFDLMQEAIDRATGAGGKFENGAARLARTTAGKYSTMIDNIKLSLSAVGDLFLPAANVVLDFVTEVAQGFQTHWVPVLRDVTDILGVMLKGVWDLTAAFASLLTKGSGLGSLFGGLGSGLADIISGMALFANNWKAVLGIALIDTEKWVDDVLKEIARLPAGLLGLTNEMDKAFQDRATKRGMLKTAFLAMMEQNIQKARELDDKAKKGDAGGEEGAAGKSKAAAILSFEELSRKVQQAGQNPVVKAIEEGNAQLEQINAALDKGKKLQPDVIDEVKKAVAEVKGDQKKPAHKKVGHLLFMPDPNAVPDAGQLKRKEIADRMREQNGIMGPAEMRKFFADEERGGPRPGIPFDAPPLTAFQRLLANDQRTPKDVRDKLDSQAIGNHIGQNMMGRGAMALGKTELVNMAKHLKTIHDDLTKKGIKINGGMPAVLE